MINRVGSIALLATLASTIVSAQVTQVNCGAGPINATSCVNGANSVTVTSVHAPTAFSTDVRFGVGASSFVSGRVNSLLSLFTLGPVRPGLLVATAPSLVQGMHTSLTYEFTVGSSCFGIGGGCMPGGVPPAPIPFTLGQPFDFRAFFFAQNNLLAIPTSTFILLGFEYRLTETDGRPVEVFATPEPNALALAGFGILALAGWVRRRSSRSPQGR